ncbi:hypothetical protein F5Y04DRAFT_266356 [Hypomontagnella monticulosa]|nr:hypothetical protein F5Y04DRAFT_266356 [Hypomontagnella monticulosa]
MRSFASFVLHLLPAPRLSPGLPRSWFGILLVTQGLLETLHETSLRLFTRYLELKNQLTISYGINAANSNGDRLSELDSH